MIKRFGTFLIIAAVMFLMACSGQSSDRNTDLRTAPGDKADAVISVSSDGTGTAAGAPSGTSELFGFTVDCGEFSYSYFFDDPSGTLEDWIASRYNRDGWYISDGVLYSFNGLCYVREAEGMTFERIMKTNGGVLRAEFTNSSGDVGTDIYKSFTVRCGSEEIVYYYRDALMTVGEWLDSADNTDGWYCDESGYVVGGREGWSLPLEVLSRTMDDLAVYYDYIEAFKITDTQQTTDTSDVTVEDVEPGEDMEQDGDMTGEQPDPDEGSTGDPEQPEGEADVIDDADTETEAEDDPEPDEASDTVDDPYLDDPYYGLSGVGWEWCEPLSCDVYDGFFPGAYCYYRVQYPRSVEIFDGRIVADLDGYGDSDVRDDNGIPTFFYGEQTRSFDLTDDYRIYKCVSAEAGRTDVEVGYADMQADLKKMGLGMECLMKLYVNADESVFDIWYFIY